MRNIILGIVGLLLVVLLIFLGWWVFFRNGSPVAENDANTTAFETAVSGSVSANDSDPDGDPLIFQTTLEAQPTNGTATLDSAGTYVYTPGAGFSGEDSFTYRVCDPDERCDTAVVTITVAAEDVVSGVVANDDMAETMLETAVSIGVTANDQGENLTGPTIGTGPVGGTAVVEADLIVYTPGAGFMGPDSFSYSICNDAGVCDSAQVTVTVRNFQLTNDQFNTPKNVALAANVKDNDNGELTVTVEPTSAPTKGTVALQNTGEFTYTPTTDFVGEDSFTYEACSASGECATAVVSIKVGGPVVEADTVQTSINKPVSDNVLDNDEGDNLLVKETPAVAPTSGGLVLLSDGRFTYTPDADFSGSDTFTYETCDGDGLCAQAVVTIEVQAVPETAVHTVSQGEWLLQIARCYGTTVRDILRYNYIYYPDYIYPGQHLFIPNIGSAGPYLYDGTPCVDHHKVEAGETLESIAAKYNITESELARINGLYTRYYVYYDYPYYVYSYRPCCGYAYYPTYGYYYSYTYRKDIYTGQMLVLPKPVPDYMRAGS